MCLALFFVSLKVLNRQYLQILSVYGLTNNTPCSPRPILYLTSFGINNVFISDEVTDIFNPNVIRSSIGHIFNTNIWSGSNQEVISILEKNNYQILLLDPEGDVDIEEFTPNLNYALVVGAEQYGISDDWFKIIHTSLRIRSTNNVDSLNASTAAAIGMWELTK